MKPMSRRGLQKKYCDLDKQVYDWLIDEKKKNKCPTKSLVQEYARMSYHTAGHSQFKASDGWYRRWRTRWLQDKKISDIQLDTTSEDKNITSVINEDVNKSQNKDASYDIFETLNSLKQLNKLASGVGVSEDVGCESHKGKSLNSKGCIYKSHTSKRNNKDYRKVKSQSNPLRRREIGKVLRKRLKYLPNFREEVLLYAKSHSIKDCSLKFNLNQETICNWKRSQEYTNLKVNVPTWDTNFQFGIIDCTVNENSFIAWLKECRNVTKNSIGEKLKEAISPGNSNSEWFSAYARRYIRILDASSESKKHSFHSKLRYPKKFRDIVIHYSKLTSQKRASILFNISRKSIYSWMKPSADEIIDCDKEKTKGAIEREVFNWYESKNPKPKPKQIKDRGRTLFLEEYRRKLKCSNSWYYRWCQKYRVPVRNSLDDLVLEWLLIKMDENEILSHKMISEKATEIYKSNNIIDFNVSTSWVLRFCRRHMRLLRCIPSLSDKLPKPLENKIKEFRNDLSNVLSNTEVTYELFGAMDELPLKFIFHGECPKQKPLIRQCGFSGINCTVVLCCDATGELFPPFMILKGEREEEIASLFVQFQNDGKMDENMMKHWINEIWFRFKKENSLLLLDTYKEHTKEWVAKTFEERYSKLVIVPGGCTSKLMPLTQVVSKRFEDLVEEQWKKWMNSNTVLCTEQLSPPESIDIVKWIQIAYETICDSNIKDDISGMFEEMKLIPE